MGPQGGFGLFSIRERIDLIGGRVDIDSGPGLGTRVTLVAPLARPPAREALAAAAAAEPAGAAAAEAEAGGRKIRVLVADDHKIMREGLTRLLKGEPDMEVVGEAADGQEALDIAHRLRPDVVIMDLSMPRMNGIEATQHIRDELPCVRVVGLSMYEQADRADAMLKAGAVAYLNKAGPSGELIAAIRKSPHGCR